MKTQFKQLQQWQREGKVPKAYLPEELDETHCLNCGTDFKGSFCPNCGQKSNTRRLTLSGVMGDALQLVGDLDIRLLRTTIELMLRPGYMIYDYIILGKRKPYIQPITLLVLFTSINLIITKIFNGEIFNVEDLSGSEQVINQVHSPKVQWAMLTFKRIFDNDVFAELFTCFFLLWPNKRVFRKTEVGATMNYLEHFYLLCYISCVQIAISTFLIPICWLFDYPAISSQSTLVIVVIVLIVNRQFFKLKWKKGISYGIRVFLNFLLLCALFILLLVIFLIGMEMILKHMGYENAREMVQKML